MPRTKRITKGGIAYHALNRANGKLRIFNKALDFIAFENILAEGIERFEMRLCGYCIMSNHWHLLLWPAEDNTLSQFMHWITLTHIKRWHTSHGTTGMGHLYQDRFKSFPIQSNVRYLKAMRYIEANPLAAGIVETAADWQWSSFAHRINIPKPFALDPGPVPVPKSWAEIVNKTMPKKDSEQFANCIKRGCPYGEEDWANKTAELLNLQSTMKKPGRPRKYPKT
jgi:putative transposase